MPMMVFLSEDWREVGHFGDRTLNFYRAKAARELERTFEAKVSALHDLDTELGEWVDIFERMLIMLRLSPPLRLRHGD